MKKVNMGIKFIYEGGAGVLMVARLDPILDLVFNSQGNGLPLITRAMTDSNNIYCLLIN